MRFSKPPYTKKNIFLWWFERILRSPVTISLALFCSLIWWQEGYFPLSWSEWQYRMLLQKQNAALHEITTMLRDVNASSLQDSSSNVREQVEASVEKLQKDYEAFLKKYPFHDRAMASLGGFFDHIGQNETALVWWAKACHLTKKNPNLVNALAEGYNNTGEPSAAIELYESAVETNPKQGSYHYNLGQMYYVFRKETTDLHQWDLKTIIDKSLEHLDMARKCDQSNFEYASTYAETFYGAHILLNNSPWNQARQAWEDCLHTKMTPEQHDLVRVHLVRVSTYLKDPVQAMQHCSKIKGAGHRRIAMHLLEKTFPDSFSGLLQI